MFFDKFLENLPGEPEFERFYLRDRNPLGGTDKVRICSRENWAMKIVQRKLLRYLRNATPRFPFATAFNKKDSPLKNVKRHKDNRYFYFTDIHNAFPSVRGERLAAILCELFPQLCGQEKETLAFLQRYSLSPSGGLVIGASASPILFNIYAGVLLDRPIGVLCERYGITYSRYSDDLTFSSKRRIGRRKRKAIRKVIEDAEFAVSHRKSAVHDLRKGPIVINGIGLQHGGRTFLPRHYLRKIKGMLHRAKRGELDVRKIHGRMGVLWSTTSRYDLNKTERRLVDSYRAFCREANK